FRMSEPDFLISIMDRHSDYAVIVCLIGGGQEIHDGEAGLIEWFKSLRAHYQHWNVYVSDRLTDSEYTRGEDLLGLVGGERLIVERDLHLAVPTRSFRS